jgi:hypothetical protein
MRSSRPNVAHATSPDAITRRRSASRSAGHARFLVINAVAGALVGLGVLAGLLLVDADGLGSLLAGDEDAALALALLAVQFAVGFASFAAATAVFLMRPGREPTPFPKAHPGRGARAPPRSRP